MLNSPSSIGFELRESRCLRIPLLTVEFSRQTENSLCLAARHVHWLIPATGSLIHWFFRPGKLEPNKVVISRFPTPIQQICQLGEGEAQVVVFPLNLINSSRRPVRPAGGRKKGRATSSRPGRIEVERVKPTQRQIATSQIIQRQKIKLYHPSNYYCWTNHREIGQRNNFYYAVSHKLFSLTGI